MASGIRIVAQTHIDSLINNELPSFDESYDLHSFDVERYTADTLYARIIPTVDMEVIEDRASCLNLDMPLVINKTVCGFINFFTVRKRNYTQTMLERKNYYFPIFEYYLKKHNMPDALKYLSIVESGLNFKARSKAGAVGLWQFMPGTGKDFYLSQDHLIDERQNPYLATEAACKFLKYLYRMYGDWELALAAYNCGPGNVNKAIKKSGKRSFWDIYNFLPQETRSYVPQFHAVVYTMNFASEHNIHADVDSILVTHPLDTFQISKPFDVVKLEAILGLPANSLRQNNPMLSSNIFPVRAGFSFLVPTSHSFLLASNLEKFIDSAAVTYFPEFKNNSTSHRKYKWENYLVPKGETIAMVAKKFGTNPNSIKKWNRLASNKLPHHSKIRIKVQVNEPVSEAVASVDNKVLKPVSSIENHWVAKSSIADFHLVKQEEKLYQIAIQYGKTVDELKKLNSLASAKLHIGQKIWLVGPNQQETALASDSTQGSTNPAFHIVKSGEGLFSIARNFGVQIGQLRSWNQLKSDELRIGQMVYLMNPTIGTSEKQLIDSFPQNEVVAKKTFNHPERKNQKVAEKRIDVVKIYQVQKGDTLYSISKKFTKLTIKDIIRMNKLKDKSIKPGQQLIIG